MKHLLVLIISLVFSSAIFAQSVSTGLAEEAYNKGDYKEAIAQFENTLHDEGFSDVLYYNLGNSYFKDRKYPQAILNYEKALKINPNFTDAKFNLQIAQQHIVDKIDSVDRFFLVEFYYGIVNLMVSNAWAILAVAAFIFSLALIFVFFFSNKIWLKKTGFFGAIFLLAVCIFSNFASSTQKHNLLSQHYAIVFTPSVTVKSSPAESGTELFVIHEGTKVKIRETLGQWSEIEIADGNIGWMQTSGLEKI